MITRYCIEEAAREPFRKTATPPEKENNTRVILSRRRRCWNQIGSY